MDEEEEEEDDDDEQGWVRQSRSGIICLDMKLQNRLA